MYAKGIFFGNPIILLIALCIGVFLFRVNKSKEKQSLLNGLMVLFPLWLSLLCIGLASVGIFNIEHTISGMFFYVSSFIYMAYIFMLFCTTFYVSMQGKRISIILLSLVLSVLAMFIYSILSLMIIFIGLMGTDSFN